MRSEPSDRDYLAGGAQLAKIVIGGAFGVGKTTFVATLSEVRPLRTEEPMTQASIGVDDLRGRPDKSTTTVGLDWGRLTIDDDLVLFLFGAPGQARFQHIWQETARGAWGALILADTRHLEQSFDSLGLVEEMELPYAVAINDFPDSPSYLEADLRQALDLPATTPLVTCNALSQRSAAQALTALLQYLMTL
ncbi:ATP-binding protein [Sphaerisporangium album]|uniref:ATP-binding protein n=1 Tax=Sphaerisporangium album TaxID=509200 RepID=A0A367EMX8_9ACTN|nr:ATP/GTP-binding protein [Sphaerisporangium album]RCG19052.1 ATP-binding protein [Sphaerisporangium album]